MSNLRIDMKEPSPTAGAGRLRYAAELLALAVLYVAAARIGLAIDAVAGFATLVWPPSGIALAALLLRGYRLWPGIAIGAFVANTLTGAPLLTAIGIATGNTLEALLGTYALQRIPGFRTALDRVRDVLGLIVLAAALSTMVSATIGVASLYVGGIVSPADLGRAWRAWWLGDLIGDLLVAPALLVWASGGQERPAPRRWLEMGALAASVVLICVLIFGRTATTRVDSFQQAYLIFPALIWASLRFEQRGAATTALVVSSSPCGVRRPGTARSFKRLCTRVFLLCKRSWVSAPPRSSCWAPRLPSVDWPLTRCEGRSPSSTASTPSATSPTSGYSPSSSNRQSPSGSPKRPAAASSFSTPKRSVYSGGVPR